MQSNREELDPIAAEIVRSRKEKRLTQEDVAAAAGLSRRAIVMIEAGGDCSLSTLRRIFTVLGMDLVARQASRPSLEDLDKSRSADFFEPTERPRG